MTGGRPERSEGVGLRFANPTYTTFGFRFLWPDGHKFYENITKLHTSLLNEQYSCKPGETEIQIQRFRVREHA